MAKTFSWLHLSDLHWGMSTFRDKIGNIHDALVEDIKRLQDKCGGEWDAVFFTGDLANKAGKDEYKEIEVWLAKLRKDIGGDPVFLAVPGNHDLVRPGKKDAGLRLLLSDQETALEELWSKDEDAAERKTIFDAFASYTTSHHNISQAWNTGNSLFKL